MSYNLDVLGETLQSSFERSHAAKIMSKCTTACVKSYEESKILPSEERCLVNCFAKSKDFMELADENIKYYVRNGD